MLMSGVTGYEFSSSIAEGAGGKTAEDLRESTKQTKMTAEQESNFWKACDKRHYSTKLLKNASE